MACLGNEPAYQAEFDYINSNRAAANGMTKRELFAAMMMQGFAACPTNPGSIAAAAEYATKWADALLAELAKESD